MLELKMLRRFWRLTTSTRWNLAHSTHINTARSIGHIAKNEERKLEKLKSLREAVVNFHQTQKNNNTENNALDLEKLQTFLAQNGFNYKSNFEFVLLSAFDVGVDDGHETWLQLERDLFHSIANLVHSSSAVRNNKMAAIRFSVFLSSFPDYLSKEQCQFIKQTANAIAEGGMKVMSIRNDMMKALAKSSADNCRHAFELFPRVIDEEDKRDFSLKVTVLNQLVISSIQFGLLSQLANLIRVHAQHIDISSDQLGALIDRLVTATPKTLSRVELVQYFELLSRIYTPLPLTSKPQVLQLLSKRLKYKNINVNAAISEQGVCSCCGTKLDSLSLEEYHQLRKQFRSIIFDRHEELLMSNLKEFEEQLSRFEMLIKLDGNTAKPKFDLIVDGLNLGYRGQSSFMPDRRGLRNFSKVHKTKDIDSQLVQSLVSSNVLTTFERVLLIGRDHMRSWRQLGQLLAASRNVWMQFLKNRTSDDNYLLLAAIQHPDTFMMSSDLFRNHRDKFNIWYHSDAADAHRQNLPQLFIRWLRSRQIKIDQFGRARYPNQFDARIHYHQPGGGGGARLHVPIVVEIDEVHKEHHTIEWICAQP